ncbi:1-deoxy-D-xylulose-5-phosphate reductoisomerase [bacterium]|nr:1-deoxy-D-xylulose-5-phosphate reductoisomerase [candidate division CSSED10-310 bacterium]
MKRIALLGCTGSIGEQTIDVLSRFKDEFKIVGLSAIGNNPEKLIRIAKQICPEILVVMNTSTAKSIAADLSGKNISIVFGEKRQTELAAGELVQTDIVVSAVSGISGLLPNMAAISAGKDLALANKETLVVAGKLIMDTARNSGSRIIPIDSEHSAIHQCLKGIKRNALQRIILTCSGGPFFAKPDVDLNQIEVADALAHPTWNMGNKITIDSATLMNKGLEIIEAKWLFDLSAKEIDVIIHPESIIHSMIETWDGSILAQMSLPDMRLPILYAVTGGEHWMLDLPGLNLVSLGKLTFFEPDLERFQCLRLAYEALHEGGTMPAVLNAANDIAVNAFINGQITFTQIPWIVETIMQKHVSCPLESMDQVLQTLEWATRAAENLCRK